MACYIIKMEDGRIMEIVAGSEEKAREVAIEEAMKGHGLSGIVSVTLIMEWIHPGADATK